MPVVAPRRAAPVDMSRFPQRHLNVGCDAAQLPFRAYDAGDGGVVPAVLDGHKSAFVLHIPLDEVGGPLGVVGLHRDKGVVKRLGDVLGLGEVQRLRGDGKIALAAAGAQAGGAHLVHVLRPHINEGDVVLPRLDEEGPHIAAHRAGAHNCDAVAHNPVLLCRQSSDCLALNCLASD